MSYNKKAVLAANTAAIGLLLRLEKEQRTATEEEQKVLRAYQGFGGLKCILNRTDQPEDIRYWSKSEQDLFAPTCALKQLIYREAPVPIWLNAIGKASRQASSPPFIPTHASSMPLPIL